MVDQLGPQLSIGVSFNAMHFVAASNYLVLLAPTPSLLPKTLKQKHN
jgi:hypothetical protein